MYRLMTTNLLFLFIFCSCVWNEPEHDPDYLPLDDSEYPYANLPRLVIETENFTQIRDTETKVPAKLQIYGKDSPESAILDLTIKGRGNSSFSGMPKPSYKIEFESKQELFGMPKDKDWVLISNSADKTLLKNFITLKLYSWLGGNNAPRAQFVELYLNRNYLGVYLLSENIKVNKSRINIPRDKHSFLFEKTTAKGMKEKDIIIQTKKGNLFCIKSPKNADSETQSRLLQHLNDWEEFIDSPYDITEESLKEWLDIDDYLRFYWIQEFTKNSDANFNRSIFISWEENHPMHYGPVWDFDFSYGSWIDKQAQRPDYWYVRDSGWDKKLFQNSIIANEAQNHWNLYKKQFFYLPDSTNKYAKELVAATENEFKRWPVLGNTENWTYKEPYSSYSEAIDSLNSWIRQRYSWIDIQNNP